MSVQYDDYLAQHRANVKKGLVFFSEHLPKLVQTFTDEELMAMADHHDKSKDDQEEYPAYDAYFYGNNRSSSVVKSYNQAWLRHIHLNPHHWQHWILIRDEPNEGIRALDMPWKYVIEMVCDWWAFSWKSGNLYEMFEWWDKHKAYMTLSNNTRKNVETILEQLKTVLDEEKAHGTAEA